MRTILSAFIFALALAVANPDVAQSRSTAPSSKPWTKAETAAVAAKGAACSVSELEFLEETWGEVENDDKDGEYSSFVGLDRRFAIDDLLDQDGLGFYDLGDDCRYLYALKLHDLAARLKRKSKSVSGAYTIGRTEAAAGQMLQSLEAGDTARRQAAIAIAATTAGIERVDKFLKKPGLDADIVADSRGRLGELHADRARMNLQLGRSEEAIADLTVAIGYQPNVIDLRRRLQELTGEKLEVSWPLTSIRSVVPVTAVFAGPDGDTVLVGYRDGSIRQWNWRSGTTDFVYVPQVEGYPDWIHVLGDGTLLCLFASFGAPSTLLSIGPGGDEKWRRHIEGKKAAVIKDRSELLVPNGQTVLRLDVLTGDVIEELGPFRHRGVGAPISIRALAASEDGSIFATESDDIVSIIGAGSDTIIRAPRLSRHISEHVARWCNARREFGRTLRDRDIRSE